MLKHNTASEKQKKVKQCLKLSKLGIFEQHSFRRCCTNAQQGRSTTLPPKNKTTFNCANNLQKLALMNNLCFGTVVPTTTSAKYKLDSSTVLKHNTVSEKKMIVKQCRKPSKVGTVEQLFFRRCCTNPQQCRSTTLPPKNKTFFNCANNHQKLALMNNFCFGTVVPTTTSAKYNFDAGNKKN